MAALEREKAANALYPPLLGFSYGKYRKIDVFTVMAQA
jgi:hypothetical protein